jgi:H2-forming N5,N10-methylenetetrahydromethanopterin dehydrogenase-like enzyme
VSRRIVFRSLIALLVLVVVGVVAFFAVGPAIVESSRNKVEAADLPEVTAETARLHDTLQIVDMHSDTLMWDRDLLERSDRGHVDLPRLQEGNVALQVFSSVTKSPRGQNVDGNDDDTDNITPWSWRSCSRRGPGRP